MAQTLCFPRWSRGLGQKKDTEKRKHQFKFVTILVLYASPLFSGQCTVKKTKGRGWIKCAAFLERSPQCWQDSAAFKIKNRTLSSSSSSSYCPLPLDPPLLSANWLMACPMVAVVFCSSFGTIPRQRLLSSSHTVTASPVKKSSGSRLLAHKVFGAAVDGGRGQLFFSFFCQLKFNFTF